MTSTLPGPPPTHNDLLGRAGVRVLDLLSTVSLIIVPISDPNNIKQNLKNTST